MNNVKDIADTIFVMCAQEDTAYRCTNYFAAQTTERNLNVDIDCRSKMAQWCYQVSDFCKFSHETVGIGMSYLDRLLCTKRGGVLLHDRKKFQLAAMCTLYIAIKLAEPRQMSINLMAELSRGCYTQAEIVDMENLILDALEWRMNPPTPTRFVREFLHLLNPSLIGSDAMSAILDISQLHITLAVSDWHFVGCKPSTVAIASIMNSLELIDHSQCSPSVKVTFISHMEQISGIPVDSLEIQQVRQMLLACIEQSPSSQTSIDQELCVTRPLTSKQKATNPRALSPVCVARNPRAISS